MAIGICGVCQKEDDIRPYGLNGSNICFECATSNVDRLEEATRQMGKIMDQGPVTVVDENGIRLPTYDEIIEIVDAGELSGEIVFDPNLDVVKKRLH